MTESNNYCKKNPAEYTHFELAIIRVRIGTFESESQLDLEHWENESRTRVGELQNKSRARVGALGNESRARVGAFRNSRPRARMIVCQYQASNLMAAPQQFAAMPR